MWVRGVVPHLWAAFSGRACSPGLVPFCVPRTTRHITPCPSPVGTLGLRLGRGHFSVTGLPCFPPSELLQEFLIRGYNAVLACTVLPALGALYCLHWVHCTACTGCTVLPALGGLTVG